MIKQQSRVALTLDDLAARRLRLEVHGRNEPAQLRREILDALDQILIEPTQASELDSLTTKLVALRRESSILSKELKIIESLRFPLIQERQSRISEAHSDTFDWIFQASKVGKIGDVSLLTWLQKGSGHYWISGKAGSGKSTLMKYLYNHAETMKALRYWAGDKELVTASFYFWNAGSDIQKSQQGLLQTLLSTILQQCPTLIVNVFPSVWDDSGEAQYRWTPVELLKAFATLKEQTISSTRFCFFIDGLDEYYGSHRDIIDIIQNFVSSSEIKVCFSSRPWNVFANAFGANNGRKLELHEHTRPDIELFVRQKLAEDAQFRVLRAADHQYEDLIIEVVQKAQGVFLWVYLVVQSLRRGLTNFDTVSEMQRRLRALPSDLETYFRQMLDSIEDIYHKQAARIYSIRLAAVGYLTVMTVSFFDEEDLYFGLKAHSQARSKADIQRIREMTPRRILARCTDLLEVSTDGKVDFLHRTVKDFLDTRDIQDLLMSRSGTDFDAHQYLCNAYLSQLRLIPLLEQQSRPYERLALLVDNFMYHAHQIEIRNNATPYKLIHQVDQEIARLRKRETQGYNLEWNSLSPYLALGYQKDWIIKLAVRRGLYFFLLMELEQVRDAVKEGVTRPRPLLDYALRPAHGPLLESSYTLNPDPKVVRLLLEEGANPNENNSMGYPIWDSFLEIQEHWRSQQRAETRRDIVTIVELLLTHGAAIPRKRLPDDMSDFCTPQRTMGLERTSKKPKLSRKSTFSRWLRRK